jgi:hypothetical protein
MKAINKCARSQTFFKTGKWTSFLAAMSSTAELAKNDWDFDRNYDGKKVTRPNGVIYVVDGAGGNSLYNPELNGHPELWKPFQANYLAEYSLSFVQITGKRFVLRQLDPKGKEIDRIVIQK